MIVLDIHTHCELQESQIESMRGQLAAATTTIHHLNKVVNALTVRCEQLMTAQNPPVPAQDPQ